MNQPPLGNLALADINEFFKLIRLVKVLASQIRGDLPREDPFQALYSDVIAYLPSYVDEVSASL